MLQGKVREHGWVEIVSTKSEDKDRPRRNFVIAGAALNLPNSVGSKEAWMPLIMPSSAYTSLKSWYDDTPKSSNLAVKDSSLHKIKSIVTTI